MLWQDTTLINACLKDDSFCIFGHFQHGCYRLTATVQLTARQQLSLERYLKWTTKHHSPTHMIMDSWVNFITQEHSQISVVQKLNKRNINMYFFNLISHLMMADWHYHLSTRKTRKNCPRSRSDCVTPSWCTQMWTLSVINWQWSSIKLNWQHLQHWHVMAKFF